MIIGFDAKRAIFNFTGLGNYSRTLIQSLSHYYSDNQYLLYTPAYRDDHRLSFVGENANVRIVTPNSIVGRIFKPLWRSHLVCREFERHGIELFHGLSNELPNGIEHRKVRSVVTIHDLIFLRHPDLYEWFDRRIYATKVRYACQVADRIVAVSEQTKSDIVDFLGIEPARISVVYQSCDPIFYSQQPADQLRSVAARYNLPKHYLLYVGTIERRKNLLTLVKALAMLPNTLDLHIVVIGNGGKYKNEILEYVRDHKLQNRITILSGIPFADFPAIYQGAAAFVLPSLFEGFGIPIIEALWSRVPVITSFGSCFAEAGGPSSLYVKPTDAEGLSKAIERGLVDSLLRDKMIRDGYDYVQRFHPRETSEQMMSLYHEVAKESK